MEYGSTNKEKANMIITKPETTKIVLSVMIQRSGYERVYSKNRILRFIEKYLGPSKYKFRDRMPVVLFKVPVIQEIDKSNVLNCCKHIEGYEVDNWSYGDKCFVGCFNEHPTQLRENYHLLVPEEEAVRKIVQEYLDDEWSQEFPFGCKK